MIAVSVPFELHPEVLVLVFGVLALGWYTAKVVQPKAVAAGYEPIRRSQRIWFGFAVSAMWAVSYWPVHEIAEEHLYFVHMFQHLFLSMLIPAMFVLATPRWLFELIIQPQTKVWKFFRAGSKPLVAGLVFNALTLLLHSSGLVQLSFDSGAAHFALHLMVFTSGLLMWMPVVGPVEEWRISPLGKCIYLFAMSIVPTVPSGWLVFAEEVVYRHYDTPDRLWGIGVLTDQQAAGVVMKLVGGFFLWGVIFIIFTRWAHKELAQDETDRNDRQRLQRESLTASRSTSLGDTIDLAESGSDRSPEPGSADASVGVLTYEQVSRRFEQTPPPNEDR
ncbi:MAG: cytochrome c oxidase assembly protein [Acidimicrobiales bacterium]